VFKQQGRGAVEFAKLAVVILNQKIRPFTATWHKIKEEGRLQKLHDEFRGELVVWQEVLLIYTRMPGDMAGVEDDLTSIDG